MSQQPGRNRRQRARSKHRKGSPSAIDDYAQHLKSHTSALINLSETAQQLRKDAEEASKLLKLPNRSQLALSQKLP